MNRILFYILIYIFATYFLFTIWFYIVIKKNNFITKNMKFEEFLKIYFYPIITLTFAPFFFFVFIYGFFHHLIVKKKIIDFFGLQ